MIMIFGSKNCKYNIPKDISENRKNKFLVNLISQKFYFMHSISNLLDNVPSFGIEMQIILLQSSHCRNPSSISFQPFLEQQIGETSFGSDILQLTQSNVSNCKLEFRITIYLISEIFLFMYGFCIVCLVTSHNKMVQRYDTS